MYYDIDKEYLLDCIAELEEKVVSLEDELDDASTLLIEQVEKINTNLEEKNTILRESIKDLKAYVRNLPVISSDEEEKN